MRGDQDDAVAAAAVVDSGLLRALSPLHPVNEEAVNTFDVTYDGSRCSSKQSNFLQDAAAAFAGRPVRFSEASEAFEHKFDTSPVSSKRSSAVHDSAPLGQPAGGTADGGAAFVAAVREKLREVELLVQRETVRWRKRQAIDASDINLETSTVQEAPPQGSRGRSGLATESLTVWQEFYRRPEVKKHIDRNMSRPSTVTSDRMSARNSENSLHRTNSKLIQVADVCQSKSFQVSMRNKKTKHNFFTRLRSDGRLWLLVLDSVVGIFIILNALAVGLSCDVHVGWYGWIIFDAIFAAIFAAELALKLSFLGCREYFFGMDCRWNTFEASLVVLALVEITMTLFETSVSTGTQAQNLSVFRIMRLTRITRLVRVCRFEVFSELMVMIKGTIRGFKTLLWASFLLALPLYGVSILFRETLGNYSDQGFGAECFATVPEAFYTILRCITGSECTDHQGRPIFALVADAYGWGYAFVYCIVELLMTFGLFNVIIAIFIENVLAGAKANDQLLKRHRLRDMSFFAQKMAELVAVIMQVTHDEKLRMNLRDTVTLHDGVPVLPRSPEKLLKAAANLEITPEIFEEVRSREGVTEIFQDLGMADEDTFNLFETLDANNSGTLDMEELFDGIAKLRGDARRSDIIACNVLLRKMHGELRSLREENFLLSDRQQEPSLAALAGTSREGKKRRSGVEPAPSSGPPGAGREGGRIKNGGVDPAPSELASASGEASGITTNSPRSI